MTFWNWLMAQRDREDAVGDFARRARKDPAWPTRASGRETLDAYLDAQGAAQTMREAFAQAHGEWRRGTASD